MSIPLDNSFVSDTIAIRLARLQSIQSNHTNVETWCGTVPNDISQWMAVCYTEYSSIVGSAEVENLGAQAATALLREKRTALRKELLTAKQYIQSFFASDDVHRKAYGLENEMPSKADELRTVAGTVLQVHADHVTANITHRMPDALATRLQTAHTDLTDAQDTHSKENAEKRQARAAEQDRFDSDTRMLRKLLALWHAAIGDTDERIAFIGMVNVQTGGNSGQPGAPVLTFNNDAKTLTITPDANRPEATSYNVQYRTTVPNADWNDFTTGATTTVPLTDERITTGTAYQFRARARNANGYGEWSSTINVR